AEDLANKFKVVPLIVNLPCYENEQISGTIDLVTMKKIIYKKDGNISETMEIPQDIYDDAHLYREEMINILTEYDDELLRQVLENSFTQENIVKSIRKLTISRKIVPVLSGASFKNVGIPPLLDAIINYLPSPEDRPLVKKYNKKNDEWEEIIADDENFIGYIFKLQYQKEKGNIAYLRIYSGFLENGENIYNPRSEKREKTLDLLKIFSDDFERIPKALRGDIVAIVGLKDSVTGDTLCQEGKNFLLETIRFPEPVIHIRIEPKNSVDSEKFNHAKSFLLSEDPTIVCKEDTETGQILVGGMGELHLEIFIERLKREFNLELRTGPPSVARRERILSDGAITYNFENKIGGNIRHCKIILKCEKNKDILENDIIFNVNLKDFTKDEIEHIKKGINNSLKSGPEGAYRVINIKIIVEKIEFEENNLSPLVLEAASNLAVTSLLRNIKTEILEPIMTIEIDTPQCYTGGIIGDLQSRNGIVLEIVNRLGSDKITGRVPLKELFGYSTIIRNLSSGKASFTMDFFEFGR
nr:EF-Tu/IF-2/RF-3 family GTPase [Spirochaetota bacterium]